MTHSEIPFDTDDAHKLLPWVIGIMACLAALLLCIGLAAGNWIIDRHDAYSNSFTVNIPAGDNLNEKTAKVQAALAAMPGVTNVTPLSEAKLREMLKPWLGGGDVSDLPLPAVLDVTASGAPDYAAVQTKLSAIAPGTEVDAHERWVASFSKFSAAMQAVILGLTITIVASLAIMIAFASRAALKLHARTVQLLHSIGAEDNYIAGQFQREAFWLALCGAAPGCLVAAGLYWAAGSYITSLGVSILPPLDFTRAHLALLVAMPLLCGIVAWVAARLSVIRQLQGVL